MESTTYSLTHFCEVKFGHSFQDSLNSLCNCGNALSELALITSCSSWIIPKKDQYPKNVGILELLLIKFAK